MTDVTAASDARRQFRADVLAHVDDLGRMCRWVMDHPAFPIPEPDLFRSRSWSVFTTDLVEFGRLAALLADGGPVQSDVSDRVAVTLRRFGTVALEVWTPVGPAEEVAS